MKKILKKLLTRKKDGCILHVVKAMASLRNLLEGAFFILKSFRDSIVCRKDLKAASQKNINS